MAADQQPQRLDKLDGRRGLGCLPRGRVCCMPPAPCPVPTLHALDEQRRFTLFPQQRAFVRPALEGADQGCGAIMRLARLTRPNISASAREGRSARQHGRWWRRARGHATLERGEPAAAAVVDAVGCAGWLCGRPDGRPDVWRFVTTRPNLLLLFTGFLVEAALHWERYYSPIHRILRGRSPTLLADYCHVPSPRHLCARNLWRRLYMVRKLGRICSVHHKTDKVPYQVTTH